MDIYLDPNSDGLIFPIFLNTVNDIEGVAIRKIDFTLGLRETVDMEKIVSKYLRNLAK